MPFATDIRRGTRDTALSAVLGALGGIRAAPITAECPGGAAVVAGTTVLLVGLDGDALAIAALQICILGRTTRVAARHRVAWAVEGTTALKAALSGSTSLVTGATMLDVSLQVDAGIGTQLLAIGAQAAALFAGLARDTCLLASTAVGGIFLGGDTASTAAGLVRRALVVAGTAVGRVATQVDAALVVLATRRLTGETALSVTALFALFADDATSTAVLIVRR